MDDRDDTLPAGADSSPQSSPSPSIDTQPTLAASGPPQTASDYEGFPEIDRRHYVLGRELARGGMGRISIGRDRRLGRAVAIKELVVDSPDLRARFEREARITARLEHPAIVSVHEAGRWSTGEPFYAMRLVSGESLEHAIKARPTLQARMELLPSMIAATDALAYAHSERVIHRDLKPANVLVGTFGETVVIDWGLAKELDAPGDHDPVPDAGPYRASARPEMTSAGSVMGTPAYMPVEQAQGDPVDERADVYALGAMLYQVLAGVPPYLGKTASGVLDAVLAGPPEPLASRVSGVPRDLVAIVDKALARDARDRYASAGELAADLKRFQTGQLVGAHEYTAWQLLRRWVRRHRAVVAVVALALVVVAAVGAFSVRRILAEQELTRHQRAVAEKNRGEAEDLMGFMLGNLRERLEPLGKLDLLDAVAEKAVAYYADRGPTADDDELAKRALVMRQRSDILQAKEKLDDALASAREGLTLATALVGRRPTDVKARRLLAQAHEQIAHVSRAKGDADTSKAEIELALAIWKELIARPDADAQDFHGAAALQLFYGNLVRARHDEKAALDQFRIAHTYMEGWVAHDPKEDRARASLAAVDNSIAETLFDLGDTAGAIATERQALSTLKPLVAADPDNANRARNYMISFLGLGAMLQRSGDMKEAVAQLREGVAIAKRLAGADPTNVSAQADLAHTLGELGEALESTGEIKPAIATSREAIERYESIAALDPTDYYAKSDLAGAHIKLGTLLMHVGPLTEALAQLDKARAIYDAVAQHDPKDEAPQNELAFIDRHRAATLLAMGRTAEALALAKKVVAVDEALVAKKPDDSRQIDWLNDSLDALADAQVASHQKAAALANYHRVIASRTALSAKDPDDADLTKRLAADQATLDKLEGGRRRPRKK